MAQPGLTTALAINVSQLKNGNITPITGAYVDLWHANVSGVDSDEASENTVGHKFLRGYQVTNGHGNAQFVTVFPGWYSGRTPHIHIRVRLYNAANTLTYTFTSQLFFAASVTADIYTNVAAYTARGKQDTSNAVDRVFNTTVTYNGVTQKVGNELLVRVFENKTKATASFNVVLVD